MLFVHPKNEQYLEDVPNNAKIAHKTPEVISEKFKKGRYIARDGISPPTKCIRTRFFRKQFNVPYREIQEVEDEMAEILQEIKDQKKRGGQRSENQSNISQSEISNRPGI